MFDNTTEMWYCSCQQLTKGGLKLPVIKVWCLPPQTEDELNRLYQAILEAVLSITELRLYDKKAVTVLFPSDMMQYGLGEEIIIEIGSLFKKPERTAEVRQRLAKAVGVAVKKLFPAAMVECSVETIDPSEGFWSSADEKKENDCDVCGSIEDMQSVTGRCPGCGRLHQ
jgi:hypothetical protein